MKAKIFSVILSGLLMASLPAQINANAIEENSATVSSIESSDSIDAAGLIAGYTVSCTAGTKCVYIDAEVTGNELLAEIGFKNIKVQHSSDKIHWETEKTPPNQIVEDDYAHFLVDYKVTVDGGYYYRVVLDAYAKEDTWWFPTKQTAEGISNVVWVP